MDAEQFAEILRNILDRGFEPPLVCTVVGSNGSVLVTRLAWTEDGSLGTEMVSESIEGEGFALPTNVMLVDSTGEAARVTLEAERVVYN